MFFYNHRPSIDPAMEMLLAISNSTGSNAAMLLASWCTKPIMAGQISCLWNSLASHSILRVIGLLYVIVCSLDKYQVGSLSQLSIEYCMQPLSP